MLTLGIDVGGTFTDLVVMDPTSGRTTVHKVFSTARNQADGVLAALDAAGVNLYEVGRVVHGMTVATNAILERRGATVAVLTTAGFRDVLEIGRTQRMTTTMFDPYFVRPQPLAARPLRFEVAERMRADGSVEKALNGEDVERASREALAAGAESLAICFLHAHRNPSHEQQARDILRRCAPALPASLSSEIVPEYREYERFATTVANAYVKPVMDAYLRSFEERLRERGYRGPIYIMASNGGAMDVGHARERPVQTLFSGPAGGVVGSVQACSTEGFRNLISYDMGGTSTDVCLIQDGHPASATQTVVSGVPIKVPQLSINTVGAGGGSIAWIEGGTTLRVGPRSAGAEPGPASYGRGGKDPTVTDANVVLGRLAPGSLLGGSMRLDVRAAIEAVDRIRGPLKVATCEELALGILRLAIVKMANAVREISMQRGHDPREFVLVALGGAGPMHAAETAEEIGMRRVLVPAHPGNLSAVGLLGSDLRLDVAKPMLGALNAQVWPAVMDGLNELEREALDALRRMDRGEGVAQVRRAIDLRYQGQAFELVVPLSEDVEDAATVQQRFRDEYVRQYGHAQDQAELEMTTLRVTVTRSIGKAPVADRVTGRSEPTPLLRPVFFGPKPVQCAIYSREQLGAGFAADGPIIVEEYGATTVVPPSWRLTVRNSGVLDLEKRP